MGREAPPGREHGPGHLLGLSTYTWMFSRPSCRCSNFHCCCGRGTQRGRALRSTPDPLLSAPWLLLPAIQAALPFPWRGPREPSARLRAPERQDWPSFVGAKYKYIYTHMYVFPYIRVYMCIHIPTYVHKFTFICKSSIILAVLKAWRCPQKHSTPSFNK